jgi:hypothetical protein
MVLKQFYLKIVGPAIFVKKLAYNLGDANDQLLVGTLFRIALERSIDRQVSTDCCPIKENMLINNRDVVRKVFCE